jgi:hypothetical protein
MLHQRSDLGIASHIAGKGFGARHGRDKFLHILPEPLVLIVEQELRALAGRRLRDGPGNAVLVGDADDQPLFSLQQHRSPFSWFRARLSPHIRDAPFVSRLSR